MIAADFEKETFDTETLTEPDDILIEERNFTTFQNTLQEAVQTGEATENYHQSFFGYLLQTTTTIVEDFYRFCVFLHRETGIMGFL